MGVVPLEETGVTTAKRRTAMKACAAHLDESAAEGNWFSRVSELYRESLASHQRSHIDGTARVFLLFISSPVARRVSLFVSRLWSRFEQRCCDRLGCIRDLVSREPSRPTNHIRLALLCFLYLKSLRIGTNERAGSLNCSLS